mgnify:CR=1 FL=1
MSKTVQAICLVRVTTDRTHEIGEPIELEASQYEQLEKIDAVKMAEPAPAFTAAQLEEAAAKAEEAAAEEAAAEEAAAKAEEAAAEEVADETVAVATAKTEVKAKAAAAPASNKAKNAKR